jgi:hypothetical protein
LLGLDFDGQSAHDFHVKVSDLGNTPSFLQLRPGEPFYVRDLCFTLVSEEQNDQYIQLASSGNIPSYEEYSQHVSQIVLESQAPLLSSPARMKRLHPSMETPKRSRHVSSPLAKINTPETTRNHAERAETLDRTEEPLQTISHNTRKKRKPLPIPRCGLGDERQYDGVDIPTKPGGLDVKTERFSPLEDTVPNVFAKEQTKTRKSSPVPGPTPVYEDQDGLVGKLIQVAGLTRSATSKPPTPSLDPAVSPSLSFGPISNPKTPCINTSLQALPASLSEPPSSMRSTRSAVREDLHHLNMQDDGLRILLSSATTVGDSRIYRKFLTQQGVKIVQDIKDATCFCVGKEELKRTTKLILAVLKGIHIIRDTWVTDSARLKKIQDIELYAARDPQREHEWGTKLDEAIERGRQGVRIFQGWTIMFTPSAKKDLGKTNFSDLKEIAIYAGAKSVTTTTPKKSPGPLPSTLFIGTLEDFTLSTSQSRRYHTKDIISLSILRGTLEEESDEFLVQNQTNANKKRKR